MKKIGLLLLLLILLTGFSEPATKSWIRINHLGYLPDDIKVAVLGSKSVVELEEFSLYDAETDIKVYTSDKASKYGAYGPFISSYRLDFSDFNKAGNYYIKTSSTKSPIFKIGPGVYDHAADFLLRYMRQQRCGFNPYLEDSCHLDDGFIVYNPTKNGERIDVTGGWHDATDYLQYTATSANAVFQLLFSYRENPEAFADAFQSNGKQGPNGIPDVIDEAKFGMDWLKKMNPSSTEFYNQIADDRDHIGYRLPNKDTATYHPEYKGRPVYLASAEKQGLMQYQNRSTGVASTAGKYASAFAMGAMVLEEFYPEYVADLPGRAKDAYAYGQLHPGVSQTAPCKGPYFYEEENWVDDMELAAGALYSLTREKNYRIDALHYASKEKLSPWMGRDTARHYQYYPFINVGHFELAKSLNAEASAQIVFYYQQGLDLLYQRGRKNPFLIGIPFIWCSNNFVVAAITQCRLYHRLCQDGSYLEMEAALRDWLFGCNPWGTSMVVGLGGNVDAPVDPHSSLTVLEAYPTDGGLVDGPVYGSIFNNLIGLHLTEEDEYAEFQSDLHVYHDDSGDYSTNEPTMDGTASLIYYLSSMGQD